MAGIINYTYDPNQTVYVISRCSSDQQIPAINKGVVLRILASVVNTYTEVIYEIRLDNNAGVTQFKEQDVFADKASAIAEYGNRLP